MGPMGKQGPQVSDDNFIHPCFSLVQWFLRYSIFISIASCGAVWTDHPPNQLHNGHHHNFFGLFANAVTECYVIVLFTNGHTRRLVYEMITGYLKKH